MVMIEKAASSRRTSKPRTALYLLGVKRGRRDRKMKKAACISALVSCSGVFAQELWHTGTPADVYGIYFMVPANLQSQGGRGIEQIDGGRRVVFNAPNMNVNAKMEKMVGRIDARMRDVVYDDLACHYYSSDYAVDAQPGTKIMTVRRKVETWVDFKGTTKRVRTFHQDKLKTMSIDAVFGKETIEMDVVENGKKNHLSLIPKHGLEAFNNPIPDLLKIATKDRPERVWCTIDPTNAGILEHRIRLKGRFVPPVGSRSTIKGWSFEVKTGPAINTIHVSEEGQLRQIDMADGGIARATFTVGIGG